MLLFVAFLLVPIIEIALFIQVGGAIGLWPTLGIVVATAALGTWLVRSQGRQAIQNLQQSFSHLQDPTEPLAHGAMILIAGALLLTPGFFTDAVGFALLVPQIRVAVFRYVRARVKVQQFSFQSSAGFRHPPQGATSRDDVIDGEYEDVTPRPRTGPSGWVDAPRDRH
ncbi:MAG: FxsA family protein [Pseudomonadota bacterium]